MTKAWAYLQGTKRDTARLSMFEHDVSLTPPSCRIKSNQLFDKAIIRVLSMTGIRAYPGNTMQLFGIMQKLANRDIFPHATTQPKTDYE